LPVTRFAKKKVVPKPKIVKSEAPIQAASEQEPSFGQKVADFFPNLIDKIRQNRLNKLYQQGEKVYGINKKDEDIQVKLPKSINKEYLQYMQQPGFIERLGREVHGPNYRYGSSPEKDAEIQSRYNRMIGNVEAVQPRIINRGFTGEGGEYKDGKITFADSAMAQSTPVRFHEYSHAMIPLSQEKYGQEFYEMIPGSEPNVAKQKMSEQATRLNQIRGIVGQNMDLAGIRPAPAGQGADEDYYIRRAFTNPEKYRDFVTNEQLLKYYNALPENKRLIQYNPKEYEGIGESMKRYSGDMRDEYLQMPTEVRARTTALRKGLIDRGMPQNKQYTKEGVQKAVESGKLNDMGSYKELKESGLSDDQIIYLLNNLAQAPQRQAQYQALQRMS
jgi:hypothetical protein